MKDVINIVIEEDGKVRIETDGISGARHADADSLLEEIEKAVGKLEKTIKKRPGHVHVVGGIKIRHSH